MKNSTEVKSNKVKSNKPMSAAKLTRKTIKKGKSTISKISVSHNEDTEERAVIMYIDGISAGSVYREMDFFAKSLKMACRTKSGKQLDLTDEHLLRLVGQEVAWNQDHSQVLKKGDRFSSGTEVTSESFLVLAQFHLIPDVLKLRKLFKKATGGEVVYSFTSVTNERSEDKPKSRSTISTSNSTDAEKLVVLQAKSRKTAKDKANIKALELKLAVHTIAEGEEELK